MCNALAVYAQRTGIAQTGHGPAKPQHDVRDQSFKTVWGQITMSRAIVHQIPVTLPAIVQFNLQNCLRCKEQLNVTLTLQPQQHSTILSKFIEWASFAQELPHGASQAEFTKICNDTARYNAHRPAHDQLVWKYSPVSEVELDEWATINP